ncbi:GDP-mannose mannosyl hydrolase [Pseudothauera rhizosphaerae]|uniref:GDP-mannose mannosyl hydrolase n=1 Tax=Pseudothauera rhizosphaerae TaxID=2565932 RepID=A0A4S4AFK5_9RHOO|nr:GDP-mannose mannosyl hydrolase [Pseudothauera rhizosphaerae]THF57622.1 GDP-mannose mannosyl hydrolase [Pseudothauera rhizosphaerae]
MHLPAETFRAVVAATPLVSIDLVVQNARGEILLGERLNRPAKGYWFVPGGRILKNERLDNAFRRLTLNELGQTLERRDAQLLGVHEHFYSDSAFGAPAEPNTHYVVVAYRITLPDGCILTPPSEQHGRYRWWPLAEARTSTEVHKNTRTYLSVFG